MFKSLLVKIFVPIVALMVGLGASLYFVVLRTVNEFAQKNIETDLENLTHDLFNIVDNEFMQAIKHGRANKKVALRISQVDCLDILERNTYSRQFKLIVFEKQTGTILLESDLPGQVDAADIIHLFQVHHDPPLLQIADNDFHVRKFYFSPWDWNFFILKNARTYSELSQKVHRVYRTSAFVLFAVTIMLLFYLLRSIKKPIDSIVSSVSQGKPPEYSGTYEFEFLCNAIVNMRTSMKNEVAERKRAEKAAESASKAKSVFLANMSHELRTPLNAILGFTQIMERNQQNSSDEESLRVIKRSGNHLLELINQILDLSKIEAGHLTLERNCFDLFRLLDDLEHMLSLKAEQKKIALTFDIRQEVPPYICSDEVKLRQVLINLLNNAIKFTEEGSVALQISLDDGSTSDITTNNTNSQPTSSSHTDCSLKFDIHDSGVGIATEEFKHLFQAFGQTSSGKTLGQGTGLGLAISRNFVELLGGDMHITSNVGQGSSFSFTIPVQVVNENEVTHAQTIFRAISLKPGQPLYRILIVDDKWDNRRLLVELLEPVGFVVNEAENGKEALAIQKAWQPHLILMDIRMPVMGGFEATRKIRAQTSHGEQPVIIAVTACVLQNTSQTFITNGCNDILIKPFQGKDLYEMLRKHLNVKFAYEGEAVPFESTDLNTGELALSASALSALPEVIALQLKKSITALKMNTALDVIEEIRKQNESLADALQQLVREYRFDTLQKILNQREQNE